MVNQGDISKESTIYKQDGGSGTVPFDTVSNLGGGEPVLIAPGTPPTLEAKTLTHGSGLSITSDPNEIDFQNTGLHSASNLGTGKKVWKVTTANVAYFRTLTQGSGITLTEGTDDITIASSVGPTNLVNYYQTHPLGVFGNSINVAGIIGTAFLMPFSGTLDTVTFFAQNAAGTHYPVNVCIFETNTPFAGSQTYTKIYQSGNVSMTTSGYKQASSIATAMVQGRGYFVVIIRAASGGTTTPIIVGRTGGFNRVSGNIASADVGTAPASFTTDIAANTVSGLTTGTPSSDSLWALLQYV